MDDVMTALRAFEADLRQLDDALLASETDVRRHHEQLATLWRDDFARRYQQRWDGFAHHLDTYLRRDAPRYQAFVRSRIEHLGRYLGDG